MDERRPTLPPTSLSMRSPNSSGRRIQSRFFFEPVLVDLAKSEHHMRMRPERAIGADVPMHIEVGDHPARHELPFDELPRQPDAFGLVQLAWERELHLPRELRVLAQLGRLDRIPEFLRSARCSGALFGNITSEWTTPALLEKS